MYFERARLELDGEAPPGVRRRALLAALARGLESTGRFGSVRPGARRRRAASILVRIETDRHAEHGTGYGFAYRVLGPDGSLLLEAPCRSFAFRHEASSFLDRAELGVRLELADPESAERAFIASTRHSIARRWKDARDRRLGTAALAALGKALARGSPTTRDLASILAAARSPHEGVFDLGGESLAILAERSPLAADSFLGLASSKEWRHRLVAMAYTRRSFPRALLIELLRLGLADRSERIAAKAAERCANFRLVELLPDLAAAEERTRSEEISLSKELTRKGYAVQRTERGLELTVDGRNGTTCRLVEEKDLAPARLRRCVRELRARVGPSP